MRFLPVLVVSSVLLVVEAKFLRRGSGSERQPPTLHHRNLLQRLETITFDDFESGFGNSNFADGGGDSRVVSSSTYAHQGSYALLLRDNSGVASSAYSKSDHDVSGYSQLQVSFWYMTSGMETGEDFLLEYSSDGGASWSVVKAWVRGTDFDNGIFYKVLVEMDAESYDFTAKGRIRLRCDASVNNDQVFIDEVLFQGLIEGESFPMPSEEPSSEPSLEPSATPSLLPSFQPSENPTSMPSFEPSAMPSSLPSIEPSETPTVMPSLEPSTSLPSLAPSGAPSREPTPTLVEDSLPSEEPSSQPSTKPSLHPSSTPSNQPSSLPSSLPSLEPSTTPSFEPSRTLTCPEKYCRPATTTEPIECDSSGMNYAVLDSFSHGGLDLIELLGPSDPADAAAVVISVPHGGSLEPNFISDRTASHSSCPESGCSLIADTNSLQMVMALMKSFQDNYCKVPYVVINNLHRRKLDANRAIGEAAQGDTIAEGAWLSFHNFIQDAQMQVIDTFGTVTNEVGIEGAKGLFLDLHGYQGDWKDGEGGKFIQWGYRLGSTSLDPETYCPLDDRSPFSTSTVGTLSHARFLPSQSYECLVRGPGSLGSRVSSLLDPSMGLCGAGLPSMDFPSPKAVQEDPNYCQSGSTCRYLSGGYDVQVHEHLDWQSLTGLKFNAVQAEVPQCIRFVEDTYVKVAGAMSIALYSFVHDLYHSHQLLSSLFDHNR